MNQIVCFFKLLTNDEEAVSVIEYGVLGVLIVVVAIVAIQLVGSKVNNTYNKVGSGWPS